MQPCRSAPSQSLVLQSRFPTTIQQLMSGCYIWNRGHMNQRQLNNVFTCFYLSLTPIVFSWTMIDYESISVWVAIGTALHGHFSCNMCNKMESMQTFLFLATQKKVQRSLTYNFNFLQGIDIVLLHYNNLHYAMSETLSCEHIRTRETWNIRKQFRVTNLCQSVSEPRTSRLFLKQQPRAVEF